LRIFPEIFKLQIGKSEKSKNRKIGFAVCVASRFHGSTGNSENRIRKSV
jgi:hypothetical protein